MLKILKYMSKKQFFTSIVIMFFVLMQVLLDFQVISYTERITADLQAEIVSVTNILQQGIYMILCSLFSVSCSVIVAYTSSRVSATFSRDLRHKIFTKTVSLSISDINKFSTSSLINRSTGDIVQIEQLIILSLQVLLKAPIMAVWGISRIYGSRWQWTAVTLASVGIIIVLTGLVLLISMPRFKKIQLLTDKINRVIKEQLSGLRVIHAYNAEKFMENKFADVNDELTKHRFISSIFIGILNSSFQFLFSSISLAVYWIGAFLIESEIILSERISLFAKMIVFTNYTVQIIFAFMFIGMLFAIFPPAEVSAKRINEILNTQNSIKEKNQKDSKTASFKAGELTKNKIDGFSLEFKNVDFAYNAEGGRVLKHVNFSLQSGEKLAIIGATGSGKSTLIKLIMRFYDVSSGQILINGKDIRDYPFKDLNNLLAYVSQSAFLFSGSIADNIALGETATGQVSEEECIRALKIAQAYDFVMAKEDGLQTHVAQGGVNFSGGQKQRLSIARALARRPQLIIFDDSFSALDNKTGQQLRTELDKELQDSAQIIVAQQIASIKSADKIMVLEHGYVVGLGTHHELIQTCEVYREIAGSQLTKEELA